MTHGTTPSTEALRNMYRGIACQCIGQINDIRRLVGRSDTYTMRDFNTDTMEDMRRGGVRGKPTAEQWVIAARSRRREIAA